MNSDSGDDWEKFADDDDALDAKLDEGKKKKFDEVEDQVDSDDERKKEEELKKKRQEENKGKGKKASKKVDYDELYEKRHGGQGNKQHTQEELKGLSQDQKNQMMSRLGEEEIADQLFADIGGDKVVLLKQKSYMDFGTKVAETLYAGQNPLSINFFFKNLSKDLAKHCGSS